MPSGVYKRTKEHCEKIGDANRGKKRSEKTKEKMREAHKNMSKETKIKMSESHKGLPSPMKGNKHTEKAKKKISQANKGSKHSEETKMKISKSHKNKLKYKHINEIMNVRERFKQKRNKILDKIKEEEEIKMKMCEKCGLVYKKLCPICDPKQIKNIENENLKKQLKENYISARRELFDITGNSGKMLKTLVKFEKTSNALYKYMFEKN